MKDGNEFLDFIYEGVDLEFKTPNIDSFSPSRFIINKFYVQKFLNEKLFEKQINKRRGIVRRRGNLSGKQKSDSIQQFIYINGFGYKMNRSHFFGLAYVFFGADSRYNNNRDIF